MEELIIPEEKPPVADAAEPAPCTVSVFTYKYMEISLSTYVCKSYIKLLTQEV